MQYQEYISFLDDDMPQDDIDKLFSQLQAIEPPPSFISRVLSRVPTTMSSVSAASLFSQSVEWNQLDRWVVGNNRRKLC
ncbi:MAG TPA: hypothetical protein VEL31_29395 [Ktedonobacteraceae bacterium]|nr:hypothetical protein [Ktedonobacteraceae bacterium]